MNRNVKDVTIDQKTFNKLVLLSRIHFSDLVEDAAMLTNIAHVHKLVVPPFLDDWPETDNTPEGNITEKHQAEMFDWFDKNGGI